MNKRKLVAIILVVSVLFVMGMAAQLQAKISDFKLYVNGKKVDSEVVLINGKSYLPLRAVADSVGLDVTYDSINRRIDLNSKLQVTEPNNQIDSPTTSQTLSTNSRTNPASVGTTFILYIDDWLDGKAIIELTMTEIVSGSEAWDILEDDNMFNEKPADGKEYILAKFKAKVISTESDDPYSLNGYSFDTVSESGVVYDTDFAAVDPDPAFSTDVYEGATHEGWVYFYVNKSDNPVAVYDRGEDWEVWFSLR